MVAVNAKEAWAVEEGIHGAQGLWRTTDGAQHWTNVTPRLPANAIGDQLSNVQFAGGSDVWFQYQDGQPQYQDGLMASSDGGSHWRDLGALPDGCWVSQFLDAEHGWCRESMEVNFETSDGGASWQDIPVTPPQVWIDGHEADGCGPDFSFTSPTVGWAVGCGGLFETTDGGRHWQPRDIAMSAALDHSQIIVHPPKMSGADGAGDLDVDGGEAALYKSTDGGNSWQSVIPPGGLKPMYVDIIDPLHWRLADNGQILATDDAGNSWYSITPDWVAPQSVAGELEVTVNFTSPETGWAEIPDAKGTGTNVWITTNGGSHWVQATTLSSQGM